MITNNTLQRVFLIKCGNKEGTAFSIEVDGLQYLVTAKHVIEESDPVQKLEIYRYGKWQKSPIKSSWTSNTGADVALLSPVEQVSPVTPVRILMELYISQEIYFLGFPFGLKTEASQINNGYPVPLVKKGMISGFTFTVKGSQEIICEGLNNPGFSGGPIVSISPKGDILFLGIVAAYKSVGEKIFIDGVESRFTMESNAGLFLGYGLKEVEAQAKSIGNGAIILGVM